MKKFILSLIFAAMALLTFAQDKAVQKGNINLDIYSGLGGAILPKTEFMTSTFFIHPNDTLVDEGTEKSKIPLGIKAEYMVSNRIGLGLDVVSQGYEFNYVTDSFSYAVKSNTVKSYVTAQFHWGVSKRWDFYNTLGFGYKFGGRTVSSDDPKIADVMKILPSNITGGKRTTIKGRLGIRFFATPRIGVNVEAGIGGPLATFGLSTKF